MKLAQIHHYLVLNVVNLISLNESGEIQIHNRLVIKVLIPYQKN
jgi:hypothetical protein